MNCNSPFHLSTTKKKMGDRMIDPKFEQALDILAMLVRCCLTPGERNEGLHAQTSTLQNQAEHIELPIE